MASPQAVSSPNPEVSNLATPVNSSGIIQSFISNLPAYRAGLAPQRRGLEVGMAHGYFLLGPFTLLGPLRHTDQAYLAGLAATIGLVVILSACLSIYAAVVTEPPLPSVAAPTPPANFNGKGWGEFTSAFLIGGVGGAAVAYLLVANLPVLSSFSILAK
ncbi:photosystem I reaction center subunit XI [Chamaesiphon sp. VAR_48_metabat_403]|jgi:photosystem I subunit XI|uniref:photosystem I reaction center subunit XI n=1 Tax=Chamaesiphon sp. VAR_48_metabat_403 TaxID=2964700 RepID=UPI00286E4E18|nr:photosystem I reaction center subunit XI [Chamaesiphon sp. VAR_48_metabat_403]